MASKYPMCFRFHELLPKPWFTNESNWTTPAFLRRPPQHPMKRCMSSTGLWFNLFKRSSNHYWWISMIIDHQIALFISTKSFKVNEVISRLLPLLLSLVYTLSPSWNAGGEGESAKDSGHLVRRVIGLPWRMFRWIWCNSAHEECLRSEPGFRKG